MRTRFVAHKDLVSCFFDTFDKYPRHQRSRSPLGKQLKNGTREFLNLKGFKKHNPKLSDF